MAASWKPKTCRKDAHTAEIGYDTLVARSAMEHQPQAPRHQLSGADHRHERGVMCHLLISVTSVTHSSARNHVLTNSDNVLE